MNKHVKFALLTFYFMALLEDGRGPLAGSDLFDRGRPGLCLAQLSSFAATSHLRPWGPGLGSNLKRVKIDNR